MGTREGYLMKHGTGKLKVWQKRWFVLDIGAGILKYYAKHTQVTADKLLKEVDLQAGPDGHRAHVLTAEADARVLPPSLAHQHRALSDFDFLLFVSAEETGLHLRAASVDECIGWVQDLEAASGSGDEAAPPAPAVASALSATMQRELDALHAMPPEHREPLRLDYTGDGVPPQLTAIYDYDDSKTLGQGAVEGVVVRKGTHRATGEQVAIKEIPKSVLSSARQKETTRREMEIMTTVASSAPAGLAVVRLYAILETTTMIYIVMELVEGGELFDHIVDAGCYDEPRARQVMRQILEALRHLHSLGIIHRDIKPENILCSDSHGIGVKIADFGLSNTFGVGTTLKSQCGTPVYMAPEMLQRHAYTTSVDVWSAGIVMYIILSGSMPFYAENPSVSRAAAPPTLRISPLDWMAHACSQDFLDLILTAEVEYPEDEWEHISDGAKHLISAMLTVDTNQRLTIDGALSHPWMLTMD